MAKYKLLKGFDEYHVGEIFDTNKPVPNYDRWNDLWTWDYILNKWPQCFKLVEDDFVLPEKWCVLGNNEKEKGIIAQYVNTRGCGYDYSYYAIRDFYACFEGTKFINGYKKGASSLENYTEITFEQFKKYVLNMKEEKEIIGYKLKEECLKYSDVALKIMNAVWGNPKYYVKKEFCIEKLKQAGVLDLWFEPVYEEKFKVGDWVTIDESKYSSSFYPDAEHFSKKVKTKTFCINTFSDNNRPEWDAMFVTNECWQIPIDCLRKATPEEIKFVQQTPQIIINGYKGEFFDNYVKFGCAQISIDQFKDAYMLLNHSSFYSNKGLESITFGKGAFSKDQIKEIAEYYLNKR